MVSFFCLALKSLETGSPPYSIMTRRATPLCKTVRNTTKTDSQIRQPDIKMGTVHWVGKSETCPTPTKTDPPDPQISPPESAVHAAPESLHVPATTCVHAE